MQRLVENGYQINSLDTLQRQTVLGAAVESGDLATVRLLVENGANVNGVNKYNATPLMYACGDVGTNPRERKMPQNRPQLVEYLLNKGADISIRTTQRRTALSIAQCHKQDSERESVIALIQNASSS